MSEVAPDVLGRITETGLIGIVRGTDSDSIIPVVEALSDGGLRAVEITADTPGAVEMIREVSETFSSDELAVGVGTVLDAETARAALLAGAQFVVTPSVDRGVIETCNRYGAVVAPGVMTPTEAVRAYEAGADLCKVFPAGTLGPDHVRSLKGPLGQIPLAPTGGVGLDNVGDFIEAGATAVGVGSSLVDSAAVDAGEYERLTETATQFRERIDEARESQ